MNVIGKVLNILRDMYNKTKLCVKHMRAYSHVFTSNIVLLQGENLSPILLSMFVNNLKEVLCSRNIKLPTLFQTAQSAGAEQLEDFMRLFLLLNADDTAILAETSIDLQNALYELNEYFEKRGLNVNVNKSKIVVFSRCKIRKISRFSL